MLLPLSETDAGVPHSRHGSHERFTSTLIRQSHSYNSISYYHISGFEGESPNTVRYCVELTNMHDCSGLKGWMFIRHRSLAACLTNSRPETPSLAWTRGKRPED